MIIITMSRYISWAIFLLSISHMTVQAVTISNSGIKIKKSNCDTGLVTRDNNSFYLHDFVATSSFWNHVATYPNEYSSLKLAIDKYELMYLTKHSCNQPVVLSMTLVKKISDWHRQHGNGIEYKFTDNKLTFSSYDSLYIRLKLNNKNSYLPSHAQVKAALFPLISDEILSQLDDESAYLRFSFYGDHHTSNEISTLYGDIIVEISPKSYGDTWLDITIPFKQLRFFWQKNYQQQSVALTQIAKEHLRGLIITAETKNGKTLRHYLLDDFPNKAPEILKEISIAVEQVLLTGSLRDQ